ncbi:hypothetical protein [Halomicrobium urmianum]|uniref:hypothetical protein n=1 Tax=Halomicrobium urmianum TaxID=1586233 RepID=UPI001CDA4070|nr:hypothetical protein [Halomicrobium urmianum]
MLVGGGAILTTPNLVYGVTTRPWILLAIQSLGGIGFAMVTVATVDLADGIAALGFGGAALGLLVSADGRSGENQPTA